MVLRVSHRLAILLLDLDRSSINPTMPSQEDHSRKYLKQPTHHTLSSKAKVHLVQHKINQAQILMGNNSKSRIVRVIYKMRSLSPHQAPSLPMVNHNSLYNRNLHSNSCPSSSDRLSSSSNSPNSSNPQGNSFRNSNNNNDRRPSSRTAHRVAHHMTIRSRPRASQV